MEKNYIHYFLIIYSFVLTGLQSYAMEKEKENSNKQLTITNMPKELIVEILKFLPSSSVLNFSCTQKSFVSLLRDPHLLQTLTNYNENNPQIRLNREFNGAQFVMDRKSEPFYMNVPIKSPSLGDIKNAEEWLNEHPKSQFAAISVRPEGFSRLVVLLTRSPSNGFELIYYYIKDPNILEEVVRYKKP